MNRKNILLITTGGTIASVNNGNGLTPGISTEEMLSYVPNTHERCYVNHIDLFNIDSTDVNSVHWISITECIRDNYEAYDGFVITHGTDTLSYTSAVLSHMITGLNKPVIITGSQHPINEEGTDAVKNLHDAFTCACDDRLSGVLVVFAGRVIAGDCAKKIHTRSIEAFVSVNRDDVATVDNNIIMLTSNRSQNEVKTQVMLTQKHNNTMNVSDIEINDIVMSTIRTNNAVNTCEIDINNEIMSTSNIPTFNLTLNTNIFVLKLVPGINADILPLIFEHYDGIIIECPGIGGVPDYITDKLCKLIKTHPSINISFCSQAIYGGTDLSVYEVGRRISHLPNVHVADLDTLENIYAKMVCLDI